MEVLLLQNVAKVGKKDDLLVVGDGFALNYLLPSLVYFPAGAVPGVPAARGVAVPQ
jgi:ribosomal protein L9